MSLLHISKEAIILPEVKQVEVSSGLFAWTLVRLLPKQINQMNSGDTIDEPPKGIRSFVRPGSSEESLARQRVSLWFLWK